MLLFYIPDMHNPDCEMQELDQDYLEYYSPGISVAIVFRNLDSIDRILEYAIPLF